MVDFRIIKPVWLHNSCFGSGQESVLDEMGFSDSEKKRQVWKRRIKMIDEVSDADDAERVFEAATPGALKLAEEWNVDISAITIGRGVNGKITKADVREFFGEKPTIDDDIVVTPGNIITEGGAEESETNT